MATAGESDDNVQSSGTSDKDGIEVLDDATKERKLQELNVRSSGTSDKDGIEVLDDATKERKLQELKELEETFDEIESVPELFHDCPLEELSPGTVEFLGLCLDPPQELCIESNLIKNYLGLASWVGLEPRFIKYVETMHELKKTNQVITKWIGSHKELGKPATVGNLVLCLVGEGGIERFDVLTDSAPRICKDACAWLKKKYLGPPDRPHSADTKWQLTIHDVVSGKPTQYTACIVYADEDQGMAELLMDVFSNALPGVQFFLPQYHLKFGVYECDTTARVIEERCKGRVIFIISDYMFAAPEICRFALNFSRSLDIALSNSKTYYQACLVYADEDYRMAEMIIDLFKSVTPNALFFKPQFDLKAGNYVYTTTAKVIEERCGGKVVCLVSHYFMASTACQFACEFAMALRNGQMISIVLEDKVTLHPAFRTHACFKWYQKYTRKEGILNLACNLLSGTMATKTLQEVRGDIETLVESDSRFSDNFPKSSRYRSTHQGGANSSSKLSSSNFRKEECSNATCTSDVTLTSQIRSADSNFSSVPSGEKDTKTSTSSSSSTSPVSQKSSGNSFCRSTSSSSKVAKTNGSSADATLTSQPDAKFSTSSKDRCTKPRFYSMTVYSGSESCLSSMPVKYKSQDDLDKIGSSDKTKIKKNLGGGVMADEKCSADEQLKSRSRSTGLTKLSSLRTRLRRAVSDILPRRSKSSSKKKGSKSSLF